LGQKWTIKKIKCPLVSFSITQMKLVDVDVGKVFRSNNKPSSSIDIKTIIICIKRF
jgi:hypothetical protein